MTMCKILSTLAISLTLLAANQAYAKSASGHEWQFSLAPLFLWGVSTKGTVQAGSATAPLELEFQDDMLENLEAVLVWYFEARKNDLSLFVEHQYIDLVPTTVLSTGEPVITGFKNTMVELGIAYTLFRNTRADWQIIGGARLTKQILSVNNIPTPPSAFSSFNTSDRWADAFIGGRVLAGFAEDWRFIGRADIGAGGSELVWKLLGLLDYRFANWGSVFFGYKVLDYDYDNELSGTDRYAYNATQQGPLVGISFYW
jgi:hypothetical protein